MNITRNLTALIDHLTCLGRPKGRLPKHTHLT